MTQSPSTTAPATTHAAPTALFVAVIAAGAILGAFYFQYVMKLAPCPLCLEQRIPYYVGIPLALVVAFAAWREAPAWVVGLGFAALAIVFLVGAGLGVYHAGIEWKFWPGPTECSGPLGQLGGGGGLLEQMQTTSVVRCDEAAWRLFGISLAGYNVLISLFLVGEAAAGARRLFARDS
jgi:disulfide bond formation protein DsbB